MNKIKKRKAGERMERESKNIIYAQGMDSTLKEKRSTKGSVNDDIKQPF